MQIGPGLEIAVQDSEKALQEAMGVSKSVLTIKMAADKAVAKVRVDWGCCFKVWVAN